jgi:hypothetical protein
MLSCAIFSPTTTARPWPHSKSVWIPFSSHLPHLISTTTICAQNQKEYRYFAQRREYPVRSFHSSVPPCRAVEPSSPQKIQKKTASPVSKPVASSGDSLATRLPIIEKYQPACLLLFRHQNTISTSFFLFSPSLLLSAAPGRIQGNAVPFNRAQKESWLAHQYI